ncbi:30S ribosomal protein S8 [Striga asiatica]|uniref:30S ribosomal protein S8 n=1 Tax=Striga asiatica TaxID=4170 RepID=A0A5A7Q1X1_STRAF|nr:30S ribosomal protein S8 [Striga asiatica]
MPGVNYISITSTLIQIESAGKGCQSKWSKSSTTPPTEFKEPKVAPARREILSGESNGQKGETEASLIFGGGSYLSFMRFLVGGPNQSPHARSRTQLSHIYREGNVSADTDDQTSQTSPRTLSYFNNKAFVLKSNSIIRLELNYYKKRDRKTHQLSNLISFSGGEVYWIYLHSHKTKTQGGLGE